MDNKGYECECGFDCGLIFEDSAYEEALHKVPDYCSVLHPDCKFVGEFKTVIERTDGYIIVESK
jgi:hypothetical protein